MKKDNTNISVVAEREESCEMHSFPNESKLAVRTTKISWCEQTWNPVTGCTQISAGCKNCYAKRMAKRLKAMGNPRYANEFEVTLHEDLIEKPLHWRNSRHVFVCSMADIMHEEVPDEFIIKIFDVMNKTPQHIYYILTKRPKRLVELSNELTFSENILVGVTVENDDTKWRIDELRRIRCHTRFLSIEPLIDKIENINLEDIHWVIVGGESGPAYRDIEVEWIRDIRDECIVKDIPFYFKQYSGYHPSILGREVDGIVWNQYPPVLINNTESS